MIRILCILLITLNLTACVTPVRLGISEEEWASYTPEEQHKIKSGYYSLMKQRLGLEEEKVVPDGTSLHVRISDGQVKMPPFASLCNYTPLEFDIASGDCQTLEVIDPRSDKKSLMKACYLNKTLYLDPSRYDPSKKVGSIQLHYSPIWDRGFTFANVSSTGYMHLTNVNVAVRKYDNDGPRDNPN